MNLAQALELKPEQPSTYAINVPEGWRHGPGAFGGLVLGYIVRAVLAEEASEQPPVLDRFQVDASSRRPGMRPDSNCTESTKWTEYSESDGAKRSEQPASALRTAPQPPTMKSRQIESGLGRPLRTITATIAGPLMAGAAKVHVENLRVGKSVTVIAARIMQGGEMPAHAICVLGRDRPTNVSQVAIRPPTIETRWQDIEPVAGSLLPEFAQNFEFRLVHGIPFSGSTEAHAAGFIRLREPITADAAVVVAHADAWWPAEFTRMSAPRLMVTLSFTLEMFGGPALLSAAPLVHRSRTMASQSGYVTEARELWTEDGRLVALNQQTLAIVK
ncbi:MAG: thioesterase family protein [Polyangiaceae bacterium]|nr:thioesterase family protein [Polyangiaceae bacterium]